MDGPKNVVNETPPGRTCRQTAAVARLPSVTDIILYNKARLPSARLAFCPSCGKPYEGSLSFCPSCGKQLRAWAPSAASATQSVKYCQTCGAPNDAGVAYCQQCGGLSFGPAAPTKIARPTGVTIIGILQIIGSLIILAIGAFAATFLGPLGLIAIVFAVLPLIFAIGVFTGHNWARILMLIGAVLDILSIVGIVWGVIVLWYFTRPRVVAYFKQPK